MTYSIDGGRPQALTDTSYPFEFTAPVPAGARQIVIELSGITTDGQLVRSNIQTIERLKRPPYETESISC